MNLQNIVIENLQDRAEIVEENMLDADEVESEYERLHREKREATEC
jgi:hypothetical protein